MMVIQHPEPPPRCDRERAAAIFWGVVLVGLTPEECETLLDGGELPPERLAKLRRKLRRRELRRQRRSRTGVQVTPESVEQIPTTLACVRLSVQDAIATSPNAQQAELGLPRQNPIPASKATG